MELETAWMRLRKPLKSLSFCCLIFSLTLVLLRRRYC